MNSAQTQKIFSLIAGIWVGSFITIGFLVVPILFTSLGDRQVAGMVAASLFKTTAYIGVGVSASLMLMANYLVRQGVNGYRPSRWILLGMLACFIVAAFIIIPWMNSLRDQALYMNLSVRESSYAVLFSRLHGASSILFILQSILGLTLVWRSTKKRRLATFFGIQALFKSLRIFSSCYSFSPFAS